MQEQRYLSSDWKKDIKKYRKCPHKLIEEYCGMKLKWYQIIYYYTIGTIGLYFSKEARQERIMKKVLRKYTLK